MAPFSGDRWVGDGGSGGDYSFYTLFKPEPEARITKYIDVLIRVRIPQHHCSPVGRLLY